MTDRQKLGTLLHEFCEQRAQECNVEPLRGRGEFRGERRGEKRGQQRGERRGERRGKQEPGGSS